MPKVGTKVYALGNPGLGDSILDQSFSDGMLSSSEREFGGVSFLQHTAAVNPGNSGGPLLNEFGEVIGVITLKAELERTGFAIPAVRVREVLNSK